MSNIENHFQWCLEAVDVWAEPLIWFRACPLPILTIRCIQLERLQPDKIIPFWIWTFSRVNIDPPLFSWWWWWFNSSLTYDLSFNGIEYIMSPAHSAERSVSKTCFSDLFFSFFSYMYRSYIDPLVFFLSGGEWKWTSKLVGLRRCCFHVTVFVSFPPYRKNQVVGIGIALYTIPELRQQKYISAGEPNRTTTKKRPKQKMLIACALLRGQPPLPSWLDDNKTWAFSVC
jgi:hypothetical protein